ncbi:MAG: hypothetical protein V3T72_14460 [Thermoanaerobaculia bacterium]
MAKTERVREILSTPLTPEYLREKAGEGWRAVAVEWERGAGRDTPASGLPTEEISYGLRIADDCHHLQEEPDEVAALTLMLEQIVADKPCSTVASELNRRGFRRRGGQKWTQVSVFNMLPRLIEVAPRIYSSDEWAEKKQHLRRVVG